MIDLEVVTCKLKHFNADSIAAGRGNVLFYM